MRVRTELLPNLAEVRGAWESKHDSDEPADEHMQPLIDSLSALKEEFADEPAILSNIDREIQHVQQWVSDHMADDSKEDRPTRAFGNVDSLDRPPALVRGIFDDVDE